MKYNISQKAKTLEKLFNAGFNTEKKILSMKMEDLLHIKDITSVEMYIIIQYKEAIKTKSITAFLSGVLGEENIKK